MKNKNLIISFISLMMALQLGFLIYLIKSNEIILKDGKIFKFKTAPVDPFNAFKGRYVALNFDAGNFTLDKLPDSMSCEYNRRPKIIYALIGNKDGFAYVKNISIKKPNDSEDYLTIRQFYCDEEYKYDDNLKISIETGSYKINLTFPFSAYYLEETHAPKAEKLYNDNNKNSNNTYALIKINKGNALIQDLYINNKPIKEYFN